MTEKERQDKIEVLKVKQGIIDETEIIQPREKPPELKGWAKFKNEIYYSKGIIILVAFFVLAGGFFTYKAITKPKADLSVLVVAKEDYSLISSRIEVAMEKFTPDFDGNGYVHVDVICIPTESSDPKMYSAYRTKLFGEFTTGNTMLLLADDSSLEILNGNDGYTAAEDETALFPNNIAVTENGFHISGSRFANDSRLDTDEILSDLMFVVRKPDSVSAGTAEKTAQNHDRALKTFTNIINGEYATDE